MILLCVYHPSSYSLILRCPLSTRDGCHQVCGRWHPQVDDDLSTDKMVNNWWQTPVLLLQQGQQISSCYIGQPLYNNAPAISDMSVAEMGWLHTSEIMITVPMKLLITITITVPMKMMIRSYDNKITDCYNNTITCGCKQILQSHTSNYDWAINISPIFTSDMISRFVWHSQEFAFMLG